jgi:hypothetical protein
MLLAGEAEKLQARKKNSGRRGAPGAAAAVALQKMLTRRSLAQSLRSSSERGALAANGDGECAGDEELWCVRRGKCGEKTKRNRSPLK